MHGNAGAVGIHDPRDLGDVNGDGLSDMMTSYYLDYNHPGSGDCMTMWYGGITGTYTHLDADANFASETGAGWPRTCGIGKSALGLSDINTDGYDDFLLVQGNRKGYIGSEPYWRGYIFAGAPNGQ